MLSRKQQAVLERVAAPCAAPPPLPRALVVLAHPDDEVLALGARLERYRESMLVCVTDGAPADGEDARQQGFATLDRYREARRRELDEALALAGMLTRNAQLLQIGENGQVVQDKAAMSHLPALARALARQIQQFAPEAVLTHPYEGGHPDHDSCAFAVHMAMRLLPPSQAPVIVEAPSYHAGEHGMVTGRFLPPKMPTAIRELSPEEQARKRARLACFRTQQSILANFGVEQESFRLAPAYDFTQPPHPGPLLYEGFGWGITGAAFRRLAGEAASSLAAEAAA